MIDKLVVVLTVIAALAGCGPAQDVSQHNTPVNSGTVNGPVAATVAGADCAATAGCTTSEGWLGSLSGFRITDDLDPAEAEPDMTDELVKMAKSTITEERVSAIGQLLAGGREGDADVRETLRAALTDTDPRVRAQAISSFANREGEGAYAALQEALQDSDASVRQMAVGSANNKALLQLAVNDSEKSIRVLAQTKLEALSTTDQVQQ
jgi:HEAT repeat protein